jgi:hypothetical protein
MAVTPTPLTSANAIDLVDRVACGLLLEAGGMSLTSAQSEALPTLITAASREVQRFLGRLIPLAAYTEIVTPEGTRQDRGEPARRSSRCSRSSQTSPAAPPGGRPC